jgi:hypothetical protein
MFREHGLTYAHCFAGIPIRRSACLITPNNQNDAADHCGNQVSMEDAEQCMQITGQDRPIQPRKHHWPHQGQLPSRNTGHESLTRPAIGTRIEDLEGSKHPDIAASAVSPSGRSDLVMAFLGSPSARDRGH